LALQTLGSIYYFCDHVDMAQKLVSLARCQSRFLLKMSRSFAQTPSDGLKVLVFSSNNYLGTTVREANQCRCFSTSTSAGKFAKFHSTWITNCLGPLPRCRLAIQQTGNSSRHLLHAQWPNLMNCVAASTTTTRDRTRNKIRKKLPELNETDLEETFVRGSGPGGQSTNKTSNCVVLKHIPTGITIKCHQTRSQTENQKIARELLRERLDVLYHGEESVVLQQKKAHQKKVDEKTRRTKVKLEKLKRMKEKLNEDEM
ncbi:LOW QUALITY PROTEIN: probable peptide chain release factor C12orf65 homolog, mitochondrial, partial [Patiria miniata]|uniref:Prokaryotic-type class I peptide chain release factors domain-containing protein n=1 Tax=Patiria miniata TaxID=46514 RepID=A0A914BJN6_PATMI